MDDLRERCIEAGAYAICRERDHISVDSRACLACRVLFEEGFDACLSVLADHADEWLEASWEFAALPAPQRYVEALKEEDV